jgi:plastocyanin
MIGGRSRRALLLGVIGTLLAVPVAFAGSTTTLITVGVGDTNTFTPDDVTKSLNSGTAFEWKRAPGALKKHNVYQDDKLFSSGSPTASPSFDYTRIASAGSFHYFCQVHSQMTGFIRATPGAFNVTSTTFDVDWATPSTNTGKAFDVRYRINDGKWKTWKNDTTKLQATFGNGKPANFTAGKKYEIQARSEKSKAKPKQRSGWSPSAQVGPA